MLQIASKLHATREHRIPKNTSRNTPNKCNRKSHPNFPKPLHCNNVHNGQSLSTDAVGQNTKPNRTNRQPTVWGPIKSTTVSPRIPAWPIQLQRNSIGPNWNQSTGLRRSQQRGTWSPHGLDAWYLGPAYEHYQCYRVWIWETKAERYTDTVAWFPPPHIKMPVASKADLIVGCMNYVVRILTEKFHGTVDPLTNSNVHALTQTTSLLLHHAEESPIAPAPVPELRVSLETYQNRAKR